MRRRNIFYAAEEDIARVVWAQLLEEGPDEKERAVKPKYRTLKRQRMRHPLKPKSKTAPLNGKGCGTR